MTISDAVRQLVRRRTRYLCEYCHSSEETSAAQFAIDEGDLTHNPSSRAIVFSQYTAS
jgi:hypothetical protein